MTGNQELVTREAIILMTRKETAVNVHFSDC